MTERTEIERLLQMTGRTLEGLPEDYGDETLKVWRSFRDGRFGHIQSFKMANQILHQSDVIELLVGALRDALAIRDAAVSDLKSISHCYTCSNRDIGEHGWCKNAGGGGAPFTACPGYVWDKAKRESPKEAAEHWNRRADNG